MRPNLLQKKALLSVFSCYSLPMKDKVLKKLEDLNMYGYEDALYLGKWNGFDIFEAIYVGESPCLVNNSSRFYMKVKDSEIIPVSYEEAQEIAAFFQKGS